MLIYSFDTILSFNYIFGFSFSILTKNQKKRENLKKEKSGIMRYREDDGEPFYYDEFADLKNIFDWIFNIEDI